MKTDDLLSTIEILCAEHGKLDAIIEASYNGVFEIDERGRFLSVNPSFLNTFFVTADSLPELNFFNIISSVRVKKAVRLLFSGKEKNFAQRVELIVKADKKRFVELTMKAIELRGKKYVIGVIDDRTELITAVRSRELSISLLYRLINEMKIETKETIYHLARIVEIHDQSTGSHLERMEHYARALAGEYYRNFHERDPHLTEKYVEDLAIASILHDIGKVGVSNEILLKPAKLSEEEFELIKRHTTIIAESLTQFKGKKDYLSLGREIAVAHHERWDGKGYPRGLYGEKIPLSARIAAVCDVYDTLVSERPYKKPLHHEDAVALIAGERGKAFDPEVVEIFMKIHMLFKEINDRFRTN
jgi:PAS domain S-box-containing protein